MSVPERTIRFASRTAVAFFVPFLLLQWSVAHGGGQAGPADTKQFPPLARLRFTSLDAISPRSFPPLVIRRTYDGGGELSSILGPGWWSWPFDATLKESKAGKTNVISLRGRDGRAGRFVELKQGKFASLNPAKLPTVSLEKTPAGYVLKDLLHGKQTFDHAGRLMQVGDTRGNVLDIARDEAGLPVSVTVYRPRKIVYRVKCDATRKRLTDIAAPDGRTWSYRYHPNGELAKVARSGGYTLNYDYKSGRLAERKDSRGRWAKYDYDPQGRLRLIDGNGRKETRQYKALDTPGDWMVTITDPIKRQSEHKFLASKRREIVREKDGNVVVRQYDEEWRLQYIDSLKDGLKVYKRDKLGRVTGIVDGRKRLTQIRYDNVLGLPSAMIDPLGRVAKMRYNAYGQLRSSRDAGGRKVSVRYNRFGQPVQVDDSARGSLRLRYGPSGRLETVQSGVLGRVDATTLSRRKDLWGFLWRPAFRILTVPEQRARLLRALGRAVVVGGSPNEKGLTIRTEGGKEWVCIYDLFGDLRAIREKGRDVASFQYDDVGRLHEIRYSDGKTESFRYDAGDRVTRHVAPDGSINTYRWDVRGLLRMHKFPNGEEHVYGYDRDGRLISAYDSFWHDLFGYDSRGRLVKVGQYAPGSKKPKRLITYSYNKDGRLESTLFGNGIRSTHKYSRDGTVETLSVGEVKVVLQYRQDGRCTLIQLPAARRCELGYTAKGALSRVAIKDAAGRPRVSQYCHYRDDLLVKVTSGINGEARQLNIQYSKYGALKNATWLSAPDRAATEDDLKRVYDVLGRRRVRKKAGQETEYFYGRRGVFRARQGNKDQYLIRSSDDVVRIVIQDGRRAFVLPSALPGQAHLVGEKATEAHPVEFRDTSSPRVWVERGPWQKK